MIDVLIVGASARAAAFSAVRAGLHPACIDLFGDTDLIAISPSLQCPPNDFPEGLYELSQRIPKVPFVYTGGLENYPDLIGRISETRPLWGNVPAALAAARSPFALEKRLYASGLRTPQLLANLRKLPTGRRWLCKPFRGTAGFGVRFVDQDFLTDDSVYYQEYVPGKSMSASYVALPQGTWLLGVTEQLIGEPWLNAPDFRYCGNIGPIQVSEELKQSLIYLGEVIASHCQLKGLFGIDFILNDEGPWFLEVNPRYTASMEVLERATQVPMMALHRAAFDCPSAIQPGCAAGQNYMGKAILFAAQALVFPQKGPWEHAKETPEFADIPKPGERIAAGWPILTLFTSGGSVESCRERLEQRADQLMLLLLRVRSCSEYRL